MHLSASNEIIGHFDMTQYQNQLINKNKRVKKYFTIHLQLKQLKYL